MSAFCPPSLVTCWVLTSALLLQSWDALCPPYERWAHVWIELLHFQPFACSRSCCCSSSRSRCVYLLHAPLPRSRSLITAVRQLCLGGSHSIVLTPGSPIAASRGSGSDLAALVQITVTLGTLLPRLDHFFFFFSVSALPGQRVLHSLQQTAAILLQRVLPVCPSLLSLNQIVQTRLYHSDRSVCLLLELFTSDSFLFFLQWLNWFSLVLLILKEKKKKQLWGFIPDCMLQTTKSKSGSIYLGRILFSANCCKQAELVQLFLKCHQWDLPSWT